MDQTYLIYSNAGLDTATIGAALNASVLSIEGPLNIDGGNSDGDSGSGNDLIIIVGAVVGAVVGLVIVIGAILGYRYWANQNHEHQQSKAKISEAVHQ